MTDQVFGSNDNDNPPAETPQSQTDPFADKLKAITNEDGKPKYDSVEKALEALQASQQFIETLKSEKSQTVQELEQARAELEKMGNIDDFVKRVTPTTETKQEEQKATPPQPASLSEEKIREMLQKELQSQQAKTVEESNLNKVVSKLSELYGDKASEHVAARAKELNTTPESLRNLSRTNPDLVLATLAGGEKKESPAPSRPTQFSPQGSSNDNPPPTWEKGAARGGLTNAQLKERWNQVGQFTKKRLGVEPS